MDPVPQAVRAQVQVAARALPQALRPRPGRHLAAGVRATCPGHDVYLREAGLRFSFLEAHGLTDAHPRPSYGVHAPILSPGGDRVLRARHGVVAAGLERRVGLSRRLRLPRVLQGRRLGAADSTYLGDLLPDGQRKNLGIKYYRVTGRGVDLGHKQPYVRARALGEGREPRGQLPATTAQRQVEQLAGDRTDRPPIVVSPYDAELFGHWWYEGPQFLDFLFRKMHFDQDVVKPITPSEYLERFPELEVCQPPMCTWGAAGYAEVWLERLERLDLSAPRHGGRAHGGAGAALRAAERARAARARLRPRASCCWRSRRTGPSS